MIGKERSKERIGKEKSKERIGKEGSREKSEKCVMIEVTKTG